MIVPILSLSKVVNLNYYMIDLNNFTKGTIKIDLVTKRGRHKRAPPITVEEVNLPKKDEVLK